MTIIPPFDFDNDEFNAPGPPQWAAMYRSIGWQVVPAWLPSEIPKDQDRRKWKRPKLATWTQYQNVLMGDAEFDRLYHTQNGEYRTRFNMGILTGPGSGNRFVVDLDIYKTPAAKAWWDGLLAVHNNGMELETVEQITGGGGLQKIFRAPAGHVVPTYRTPRGVDVRGQGGFAVLAPSLHDTGAVYRWRDGFAPWEIDVAEAPQWLLDAIDELAKEHGSTGRTGGRNGSAHPRGTPHYDPWGNLDDLREDIMFRAVWHAVLEWQRECPIKPPQQEWEARSLRDYEVYEGKVTVQDKDSKLPKREQLDVEGRGPRAWGDKWRRVMAQWDDDEFQAEAKKPPPKDTPHDTDFDQEAKKAEAKATADPAQQFELLDIDQILALPDPVWVIDELIVEDSLGFIFGPPGCLKTFIAIGQAMTWVTKQSEWWGRPVNKHGAVIYISSEGHRSLKYRLKAWGQHHRADIRGAPFYLLRQSLNFMDPKDEGKLMATVAGAVKRAGMPILAIFVDTVSKVLPGAEENLQKDMTLFVQACARLRERYGVIVIGIHHTNAQGGFRGSTVIPGAGDFIIEVKREPGETEGSIIAKKIKDAEDGWEQPFRVLTVPCGDLGGHSSLVVERADASTRKQAGWPGKETCRRVLAAMGEAWAQGKPWSSVQQAGERYAPRIMVVNFDIPAKIGRNMIETWLITGVIIMEIKDFKSKLKGLRVIGTID